MKFQVSNLGTSPTNPSNPVLTVDRVENGTRKDATAALAFANDGGLAHRRHHLLDSFVQPACHAAPGNYPQLRRSDRLHLTQTP